jgi:protocatechuate 3,4-dioxygenase alpha subunit
LIGPTPSQTIGPFFSFALERPGQADLVPPGAPGALVLTGRVVDGAGDPVADAVIELWQADPGGAFRTDGGRWTGFGRNFTDGSGTYRFTIVKPGRVDDRQAPHTDVSIFARGLLQRLVTRVYFPDEVAANATDPALSAVADPARRATLIARVDPGDDGTATSTSAGTAAGTLRFDIRLQGEGETVFFAW